MTYKSFVCFVAILIANEPVFAQNMREQLVWSSERVNMLTINELETRKFSTSNLYNNILVVDSPFSNQKHPVKPVFDAGVIKFSPPGRLILQNFYYSQLGWICKQEWRFERNSGIPLRIRLGSVVQVDFLEGK